MTELECVPGNTVGKEEPCFTVTSADPSFKPGVNQLYVHKSGHVAEYMAWVVKRPVPIKKPVVYVAHPVSGAPIDNCYRTVRWLKFLINADPTRIYVAPWVGEVLGFPGTEGEDDHRPWTSALGDDVQVLERCDEILLVGGKISAGMQVELDAAKRLRLRITDMSQYRTPKDLPDGFFLDPAGE